MPLSVGELGPHLTQCRLGRGLPPHQVAFCSIEPFSHNTPALQRDKTDNGPIAQGEPLLVTVTQKLRPKQHDAKKTQAELVAYRFMLHMGRHFSRGSGHSGCVCGKEILLIIRMSELRSAITSADFFYFSSVQLMGIHPMMATPMFEERWTNIGRGTWCLL